MSLLILIGAIIVVQLIWSGVAWWWESSKKFRGEWEAREKAERNREREEAMRLKKQQEQSLADLIALQKEMASRAEGARRTQQLKHRQEVEGGDWKD